MSYFQKKILAPAVALVRLAIPYSQLSSSDWTLGVMTLSDSPGLSAIDQQWLDSLWNEEMMTLASLTHTP